MNFLTAEQATFDQVAFDRNSWELKDWRAQKTRHITLHIAKAGLKLVNHKYTPAGLPSDIVVSEVIPDLSIYRAQLINTHELGVEAEDLLPFSVEGDDDGAAFALLQAQGELSNWLEPLEHGKVASESERESRAYGAVQYLHCAVEALARSRSVDVEELHRQRLDTILNT